MLTLDGAAVLLFISDPEAKGSTPEEMLIDLWGLTGAEARLAGRLILGESVKTSADQMSVTYETARTHLQHIFDKTDTHRQSELIQLLSTSPGMRNHDAKSEHRFWDGEFTYHYIW